MNKKTPPEPGSVNPFDVDQALFVGGHWLGSLGWKYEQGVGWRKPDGSLFTGPGNHGQALIEALSIEATTNFHLEALAEGVRNNVDERGTSAQVVGFLFSADLQAVILIEKARPGWQKGKLNGVGGKIEPGETSAQAMAREFSEETGYTGEIPWELFCHYDCPAHGTVIDFYCAASDYAYTRVRTIDETEPLWKMGASDSLIKSRAVTNLNWLIPMALNILSGRTGDTFEVREGIDATAK